MAMFGMTEQFDLDEMQAVMRRDDIYWPSRDALSPPPDCVDFAEHMLHPDVYTLACTLDGCIIGYVQFVKRTSVMAEMIAGIHPQCRGLVAKTMGRCALGVAFQKHGLLKIIATIAADNKPARRLAYEIGMRQEGRLARCIMRQINGGLSDLVIYSISREGMN